MAKLIEKVYGEALFELAVEEGKTASLMEEILKVKQVLADNPELAKLMQHPGVPETEKEQVLENIWGQSVSREVTGVMLLLLKKEHYGQLPHTHKALFACCGVTCESNACTAVVAHVTESHHLNVNCCTP